jgi:hypothetical protein
VVVERGGKGQCELHGGTRHRQHRCACRWR